MLNLTIIPRDELHDDRRASAQSPNHEDNLDILSVMLKQEEAYLSEDYLAIQSQEQTDTQRMEQQLQTRTGTVSPNKDSTAKPIDAFCREQIVTWKFRVLDHFKVDREICSISMNYLDRYLSRVPWCDRRTFKRAATAALHLAIKVHQPDKMHMLGVLSELSRGEFEMMDIVEFESVLSQNLQWRLNPPTAICLVSMLMSILPTIPSTPILEDDEIMTCLMDFSFFFAELSECDYSLAVQQKCFTIAVASLFNAMEGLGLLPSDRESSQYLRAFSDHIQRIAPHAEVDTEALAMTKERLWRLYENSEEYDQANDEDSYKGANETARGDPSTPKTPTKTGEGQSVVSDSSSPISVTHHVRTAPAVLA